ncbi:MAG: Ig-like domain-containing protein [Bacteroidales bacterium]|nr:Ig-like domain-containing protein [Bacteroidales bacterium]
MAIRNNRFLRLLLLSAVLLTGCAKIVMPTGGPKDVAPPAIAKESPPNGCNNFKGHTIKISFNEFISLNNTFENVLISPPLSKPPTYTVSNKTLIIKFNDTLQRNQTYNIGFANCIQDFTEGNPIPFYNYAFSTGEAVDSFMLQGKIIDARTNSPVNGCFVFAYTQDVDSLPLTTKPQYITKTQSSGAFAIKNIQPGNYKLFALKDINNNLIYDLPNEEIAFFDHTVEAVRMPVDVQKDTTSLQDSIAAGLPDTIEELPEIQLYLFMEEDTTQAFVKLQNKEVGKYEFIYKSKIYNHKATVLSEKEYDHFEIVGRDTITWYMKEPLLDTMVVAMTVNDTVCDTLRLEPFKKAGVRTGQRRGKSDGHTPLAIGNQNAGELYKPLVFTFPYPIRPTDSVPVQIITTKKYTGNDTSRLILSVSDVFTTSLILNRRFEEKVPHTLIIPDSVFFGYNGLTNDTIRIKFTTKTEKDYGLLRMDYRLPDNGYPFVIQLLNGKGDVLQTDILHRSGNITYSNLLAGSYKIKAIEDRNGNGVWDTGNYRKKLQPERVFNFNKVITIRGYWELEEEWTMEP